MTSINNAMWSFDSRYVYFDDRLQPDDPQDIYRISVDTRRQEKLVDMRTFIYPKENWFGVSPDGKLLASTGHVMQEMYLLKCQLP
jgi:Tol biopolymer transport system component